MENVDLKKSRMLPERYAERIPFACGLLLAAGECYKQWFLYTIVGQGHYDWWYFPFQLCSLPMYLCLLLPLFRGKPARRVLCTFMQDFGLLGGVAALLVPDGFLGVHWSLSLHGVLWHVTLIFLAVFLWLTGQTDRSLSGYVRTLPLFFLCCAIATAINLLAPGQGRADMFYISPYYPITQPVFHEIALWAGILPGNLIYLASVCLGGFLVHLAFRCLDQKYF